VLLRLLPLLLILLLSAPTCHSCRVQPPHQQGQLPPQAAASTASGQELVDEEADEDPAVEAAPQQPLSRSTSAWRVHALAGCAAYAGGSAPRLAGATSMHPVTLRKLKQRLPCLLGAASCPPAAAWRCCRSNNRRA
jgi:hypothetical protein